MALVIVGCLLTACGLVYQGIYILRTGQTIVCFVGPVRPRAPLGLPLRFACAFLHMLPALAIITILVTALRKAGVSDVLTWVMGRFGMMFWSLCFVLIGVLNLARPGKMLRWTIRTSPELADNKAVIIITRLIGVGLLCMGLAMLAKL